MDRDERTAVYCRIGVDACAVIASIEEQSNTPPWPESLFVTEFSNQCAMILGARINGEIIGFLICHVVEDEAHIVNLGLRTDQRGYGYGRGLLRYCLEELQLREVQWVTLEVRASNAKARNLYESEGFLEISVRERYYTDNGEDALLLRLNMEHWKSMLKAAELSSPLGISRLTMNGS